MKIEFSNPPILDAIRAAGMNPGPNTVFTYGDTIFNPGRNAISGDLMAHEETHARQQLSMEDSPDAWWEQYLKDVDFRISQEVEAYRNQFKFYRERHSNVRKQAIFIAILARDLSGPLYGNAMTFDQAVASISL